MESLDIKKHPSEKQIEADRAQVAEYLTHHPITLVEKDLSWSRNGEQVKKPPREKEEAKNWIDSPFGWR